MSSRNSVHDFIMLLPALLLVGWLVLVIILMFRDDKCDKTYREGSFPEFICLHSDRSSLRETDSERLIVKYTEIKSWICPYISRHLLSLNPLLARCRRYSRGER